MNISRIGLGTVEIGIPYGVGNTSLPSDAEAERILKSAVEIGVTYIDTARGYGVAEERIGKSGIGKDPRIVIGTKCGQFLKQEPSLRGEELEKRIREDIDMSRRNLRQETLQLVQFHNELEDYTNYEEIISIFQKLKDEQKIQHVGVTVRGENAALAALSASFFETIQLAYSIADQRMAKNVLPEASKQSVTVLNRSVLLQGALTSAKEKLHPALSRLREIADRADDMAQGFGMSLPELAIRFALSHPVHATVLIGTVKPEHIASAIEASKQEPLSEEVLMRLRDLGLEDPLQIDPAKWPKE